MPSKKELDRALALELETNPEFLVWLISRKKFAGTDIKFHSCRADHPWAATHSHAGKGVRFISKTALVS